jgi:hypothetical protein
MRGEWKRKKATPISQIFPMYMLKSENIFREEKYILQNNVTL